MIEVSTFNHKRYARIVAKSIIRSVEVCAFSEDLTYEEMVLVEEYLNEIAERITKEDVTSLKMQEYRLHPCPKRKVTRRDKFSRKDFMTTKESD